MISLETEAAVVILQQRADVMSATSDVFELDRIDRALDQLVAHPTDTKPPTFQVRDALANASKVLKERRARDVYRMDDATLHERHREEVELAHLRAMPPLATKESSDILLWIASTPSLTDDERSLLFLLSQGEDAVTLAERTGTSVLRLREQIARARRVGRAAYDAEVGF